MFHVYLLFNAYHHAVPYFANPDFNADSHAIEVTYLVRDVSMFIVNRHEIQVLCNI